MPNSFESLFKAAAKTMPKAKSPKRNAAHYAAQAASISAQRNAIAKSLAAIARRSPQKAASLNASILARVERVEKALSSPRRTPSPRRIKTRNGRVISVYIPPPPSLNKLAREGEERNKLRRQLNEWIKAEIKKHGGVIKKY
jgi:hypothetical protein